MNDSSLRFGFGENWQRFVAEVNEGHIHLAVDSLKRLLETGDLSGQMFLDIGCGSGLFSLAACRLGAGRVIAFDADLNSVRASLALRAQAGIPESLWQIVHGDVLDGRFMDSLAPADVVYAWGALHHTGSMWTAVDAAAQKVKPGGRLVLGLYNAARASRLWWHLKRAFNRAPGPVQWVMESLYQGVLIAYFALTFRNPWKVVRSYASVSGRGMDFSRDVRDWLGGFPYEYARPGEVLAHLRGRFGYTLEVLTTVNGLGCNEFTFRAPPRGRAPG